MMGCSKQFKEIFSPVGFRLAWERYIRSCPRYSKDFLGVKLFGRELSKNLYGLSEMLLDGKYRAVRPPKYYLPKSSGLSRAISILPVQDALVYQCLADYAAEKTYPLLAENVPFVLGSMLHPEVKIGRELLKHGGASFYFFQPYLVYYKYYAESVNRALDKQNTSYRLETDITGFFDSVPHHTLLEQLEEKAGFGADVLDFMGDCLMAWSGNRESWTPSVGIPQSNASSSFFANLLLHDLDNMVKMEGIPYHRYVDDLRLFGDSKEHLQTMLISIDRHLTGLGLHLNSKKTRIEPLTEESREESLIVFDYEVDLEVIKQELLAESGDKSRKPVLPDVAQRCAEFMANNGLKSGSCTREDIIELARRDLKEALEAVALIRVDDDSETEMFAGRATERRWMKRAHLFRQAIGILKKYEEPYDLNEDETLDGWIRLTEIYFTRAKDFCQIIAVYGSESAKVALLRLRKTIGIHEWVHSEILQALSDMQVLSYAEQREIFKELRREPSWYVRRSYYHLLFSSSDDNNAQLYESLKAVVAEEPNNFLKREILHLMMAEAATPEARRTILKEFADS
jgi:hypothetical protein